MVIPYFYASPRDNESFQILIVSNKLIAEYLTNFVLPQWSELFVLGIPFPFKTSWLFHPLVTLYAYFSPGVATAIIFFLHALLAAFYIHKIFNFYHYSSHLGRFTFYLCFFWGSPIVMNLMNNFWPSVFMGYLLCPVIIFYILQISSSKSFNFHSVLFLSFFWGWAGSIGHPGCFVLNSLLFLSMMVHLSWKNRSLKILSYYFLSGLMALFLMSYHVISTLDEISYFPSNLPRYTESLLGLKDQFLASFLGPYWAYLYSKPYSRMFFAGPLFYVLLWMIFRGKDFKKQIKENSMLFSSLVGVLILFFPIHHFFPLVSNIKYIKDGLLIFVIFSTIIHLEKNMNKKSVKIVLILQVLFLLLFFCFTQRHSSFFNFKDASTFDLYQKFDQKVFEKKVLSKLNIVKGRSIFDEKMYHNTRGGLGDMGISHGIFQLHGLQTLNYQHLKGISVDPIHASSTVPYGTFKYNFKVLENRYLLDFLGIKNIFFMDQSRFLGSNYQEITREGSASIYVMERLEAKVNSYKPNVNFDQLNQLQCSNKDFNCLMSSPGFIQDHKKTGTSLSRLNSIYIDLETPLLPNDEIIIPYMYRQEWKSNEDLNILKYFNSLIKIKNNGKIPLNKIELTYQSKFFSLYFLNMLSIYLLFFYFIVFRLKKLSRFRNETNVR
jgi:hypothetical protein